MASSRSATLFPEILSRPWGMKRSEAPQERRGWSTEPCEIKAMETVDEVFQNLVRDLQSVTLTADSPKAPDRAMTFSARRRTALRLVQVAIETHESTQSTLSSLSGADLAKQWRRSRDLIVKALNWVPPLRARRLWYETQTFSEVVEHCELAHIAYLTVTRGSEQAVDAIREFAQSAELVAALAGCGKTA